MVTDLLTGGRAVKWGDKITDWRAPSFGAEMSALAVWLHSSFWHGIELVLSTWVTICGPQGHIMPGQYLHTVFSKFAYILLGVLDVLDE